MKQPKWTREEELLLVDMYFRLVGQPEKVKDECEKLSELLRAIDPENASRSPQYRNTKGIYMKYMNIRYLVAGIGLSGFSRLDEDIVKLYQEDNPKFQAELDRVKKRIKG